MSASEFVKETKLSGVYTIERPVFPDERGFFHELFRADELAAALGQPISFVQANQAHSMKHTLRGIHIAPWHKLITVMSGEVQAVIVDTRPESLTFGQHLSMMLDGKSGKSLLVPPGCGNSYLVTSDAADYLYLVDAYWAPGKEIGVQYNDVDLGIAWQTATPLLSEKDLHNPTFREVFPDKF